MIRTSELQLFFFFAIKNFIFWIFELYISAISSRTPPLVENPPLLTGSQILRFGGLWGFEGILGVFGVVYSVFGPLGCVKFFACGA